MAQTDLDRQLEGYFRHLEAERSLAAYTVRNYRNDLAHLAAFLREQGIASFAAVDRNVLRRYLAALIEQGYVRPSIARKLSAIRSLLRHLLHEGVMAADPTANLSTPKLERRLPEFLSQGEATALIAAVPASPADSERKDAEVREALALRDRALLEVLYAAGLRVSEAAGLDVRAVDVGRRELRVWGKGGKERMTLMGKPAAAALKRYLHKGRKVLAGDKKQDAVFLNRFGGRLTPRSVQALLRKYALLAGVEKHVHPHLLRHTFATHMLDGGADLRVVQELLGHSKLATTQIYTHVSQKQLRKVYDSAFFNQMRDRKEGEDADTAH